MIKRIDLTSVIRQNIIKVANDHSLLFKDYEIIVGDEKVIAKEHEIKKPNTIYIAIAYGGGSYVYDFGEQGFTLNVISDMEAGKSIATIYSDYSIAWQLLELYYHTYNLTTTKYDKTTIKQVYNMPTTLINFEEVGTGLRSLISMSGSFNISHNLLDIEKLEYIPKVEKNEVAILTIQDALDLPDNSGTPYETTILIGGYRYILYFNDFQTMTKHQVAHSIETQLNAIGDLPFTIEHEVGIMTFTFLDTKEQEQEYYINFLEPNQIEINHTFTINKGGLFDGEPIAIPYIQVIPTLKVSLKPNVYPYSESDNKRPFSRSIPQYATLVLTINVLSNDNPFTRKIWALLLKQENIIETSFKLNIYIDDNLKLENEIFYLDNAPITKVVGEVPSITITLTN